MAVNKQQKRSLKLHTFCLIFFNMLVSIAVLLVSKYFLIISLVSQNIPKSFKRNKCCIVLRYTYFQV